MRGGRIGERKRTHCINRNSYFFKFVIYFQNIESKYVFYF